MKNSFRQRPKWKKKVLFSHSLMFDILFVRFFFLFFFSKHQLAMEFIFSYLVSSFYLVIFREKGKEDGLPLEQEST